MPPEFWELDEAALWGEVDAAWLLEQFRRNEVREARAHRQALLEAQPSRWVAELAELIWTHARMAQEACISGVEMRAFLAVMAAPPVMVWDDIEPRPILTPPTWTALPTPRALSRSRLRDWHARLPCRPYRGPATRRC